MLVLLPALDAPTTVNIVSSMVRSDDIVAVVMDSVDERNKDGKKSAKEKDENSSEHPL